MAMGRTGHELEDELGPEGGSPPGGWDGAGRPREVPHHGKDGSARGRDPLGAHDKKKGGSSSRRFGKHLALAHFDKLKKTMKFNKYDTKIITEAQELEDEYNSEVSSLSESVSNE